MNRIHGPILSSSDIDFHCQMFNEVFGMQRGVTESLTPSETKRLLGVTKHSVWTTVMTTPETDFGIRILQFDPVPKAAIRQRSKGMMPGAAKVIDFFTTDLRQALKGAREFGLDVSDDIAEYDSPEGRVREAHAWVLDEVVCAFIEGSDGMFTRFTAGLDRLISEPQSISGPTHRLDESVRFFNDVFELDVIYRYEVNDSNFGDMIGSDVPVNIKARNIGSKLTEPYIGLIDYGIETTDADVIPPVALPARGLLGVTVISDDLEAIARRAADPSVVAGAVHGAALEPWGRCSTLLLRAPNGMLLHVVQAE